MYSRQSLNKQSKTRNPRNKRQSLVAPSTSDNKSLRRKSSLSKSRSLSSLTTTSHRHLHTTNTKSPQFHLYTKNKSFGTRVLNRKMSTQPQTNNHIVETTQTNSATTETSQLTTSTITPRLLEVRQQLITTSERFHRSADEVTLLAVSKTHPNDAILEAYNLGQRKFGENYVHELVEKAPVLPADIEWHFIGGLQSNKAKFLAQIPNLALVESIDSMKLALKLNNEIEKAITNKIHPADHRLPILVQVNTSDEPQKGGIEPDECVETVKQMIEQCPRLKFKGLMTIGKVIDENNPTAAPYFATLVKCRDEICKTINTVPKDGFILSMGMTHDYETAIEYGSTEIRVGTAIFGNRTYLPKQ